MSVLNLDSLLRPKSVAVIGASCNPESLGAVVMRNLLEGAFGGPVYPVHPEYESVSGLRAYRDLASLPETPDMAVLCTPPRTIPGLIAELAARGTRAAVVLTAGLSTQKDDAGVPLDEAMLRAAARSGIRILGPNCIGLLSPRIGLNASFAQCGAAPGNLAFVSQSGALCTAVLGWAQERRIGFSAFVSLGASKDVDFGDVVDWLGADPDTRAILLYVESLKEARKFLSATRAASRNKPVVAIKAGRVSEGQAAAASHTGALAGSDDVYDYALRRAGALRVERIDELFAAAETIERLDPVTSEALTILTNGGGPGVMATDALIRGGGRLAELSAETLERLDAVLPLTWSRANPVDIVGDAREERYRSALSVLADAEEVESLLVIHAPTAMVSSEGAARAVLEGIGPERGRLLSSWLGGESSAGARRILTEADVASYDTPEDAIRAFLYMNEARKSRKLLMQTPPSAPAEVRGDLERARLVLERRLESAPDTWLGEIDSKEVLKAFGVPVVQTRLAHDAREAVELAAQIGFPVALKVLSPDVLHKSDVGGVVLDLETPDAVASAAASMTARLRERRPEARLEGFTVQEMARRSGAFEVIVGASVDPIFGPFLMFGHGGTGVEVLADTAVALPPLNMLLAEELISRTRVSRLLRGYRDRPPVDLDALRVLLLRVSHLVAELPEVVDLDVNPVLVDERGVIALDARIRVTRPAVPGLTGSGRLAIRPYPSELEERVALRSGRRVLLRPIRPEDEPSHRELFRELTPQDVRFRFFHMVRELPHSELARYTQIDYEREMAFIALEEGAADRVRELGVVRAAFDPDNVRAEFAIVIAPRAKGEGLGGALLEKLIRYARSRGARQLHGRVLLENGAMLGLARSLGFAFEGGSNPDEVETRLDLTAPGP